MLSFKTKVELIWKSSWQVCSTWTLMLLYIPVKKIVWSFKNIYYTSEELFLYKTIADKCTIYHFTPQNELLTGSYFFNYCTPTTFWEILTSGPAVTKLIKSSSSTLNSNSPLRFYSNHRLRTLTSASSVGHI